MKFPSFNRKSQDQDHADPNRLRKTSSRICCLNKENLNWMLRVLPAIPIIQKGEAG